MTSQYPEPFLRVHGSRVAAVIAAICAVLSAVAYCRTSYSTAEVRIEERREVATHFSSSRLCCHAFYLGRMCMADLRTSPYVCGRPGPPLSPTPPPLTSTPRACPHLHT